MAEAPINGTQYGRKDGAWAPIIAAGLGAGKFSPPSDTYFTTGAASGYSAPTCQYDTDSGLCCLSASAPGYYGWLTKALTTPSADWELVTCFDYMGWVGDTYLQLLMWNGATKSIGVAFDRYNGGTGVIASRYTGGFYNSGGGVAYNATIGSITHDQILTDRRCWIKVTHISGVLRFYWSLNGILWGTITTATESDATWLGTAPTHVGFQCGASNTAGNKVAWDIRYWSLAGPAV